MIEQTGGLGSTLNNDRIYRDNAVAPSGQRQPEREQQVTQQETQPTGDTVSLSAQAVALARNVPATTEAAEAQEAPPQEAPVQETPAENAGEQQRPGTIDIQV